MGRTVKDTRLETRTARARLPTAKEPYWREISQGAHIGYFKGKRVGKWLVRYRPLRTNGAYRQTTLGVADDVEDADGGGILDFRTAQSLARDWLDKVARGGEERRRAYTVSNALDDYMAAFSGKSVAATTARVEAIIRPALGALDTDTLTQQKIAAWHRERANSAARLRTSRHAAEENTRPALTDDQRRRRRSTANRDLTVLKAALNHAYREGRIAADDAWRRVRPFAGVDAAKLRYLSDDEARRLVRASDNQIRPLVQAALLTGARYGDLRTLRVCDIDLVAGTVMLPAPKGGKPYVVYLGEEAVRFFEAQSSGKDPGCLVFLREDGSPWKASHQSRPLDAACVRAGIDRATFHDLRRTYGARLARQGVPMTVIAEALGHADDRTTRRHYAHLAPSYVADTVRQFTAGMNFSEHASSSH